MTMARLLAAASWELLVRGAAANEAAGVYAEHRLHREHATDNACLSPLLPARSALHRSASLSAPGLRHRRTDAAGVSAPETTTEPLHASYRFGSEADAGQHPWADAEAGKQPLAGLRVLVVDDNELNCKLIERLLKSCGASGMAHHDEVNLFRE
jgi:CheY-like chemotaxis protein